ncbi:MAG: succinylglutamate desuccinylase/aspartoacylase family protein [Ardenticatenaceae bacterium]|nr:succinylglutamate desuccinylase/aspartoacylase family protein [Ardenticatenaceae bacterium]MCB9444094.1 succinylglutamate desuccinylase/aspartoacylase family protein [Ardenticatenaceae bacterium]
MSGAITLGTATAVPGTIQYGQWGAISHPTGHDDFLPVIIAQGQRDGPCIWLTAGIHGPEHAGPSVLYRLITQELVDELRGTIVALPALSPAGLRTKSYVPYHLPKNPNRMWPDGKPAKEQDPDLDPPSAVEHAFARLFEIVRETADYMIDYHNAWIDSISFVFQDRVLYRNDGDAAASKAAAETLAVQQQEMMAAYGHTIVTEFPAKYYVKQDLHRSTTGAALLVGGIPSFTVELGTGLMPDPAIVAASAAGTRNVLRWAGMLDSPLEPINGIKVVDPGFRTRRSPAARVDEACVVLHLVQAGDMVKKGDPIAEIRDVWGRPLNGGLLRAQHDGFVIGRAHGIYFYPGDTVVALSIRDEEPVVAPYPDDYYDK